MATKILLIDDREENLTSIEAILESGGYLFVKALSGREALRILLKEYDFSLILMDVNMPNLNGYETASLIYERDRLKQIPIIFITANDFTDEGLFKGYQAGAVDYLYKPINPGVLRAKVSVFVELYEKTQKLRQQASLLAANRRLEKEIIERKASEKKIQELNHQLVESIEYLESVNKELDHFSFMASHDLQEPLRKIRLFSNKFIINNKDKMPVADLEDIYRIQKSAEKMQALIQDLLKLAKVSSDSKDFVPTDINELIEEVINELQDELTLKKVKVITEKIPLLPAHRNLIKVVFENLINNALKFSRKDVDPIIHIHAEVSSEKNDCRIFIKDNGIGFEEKFFSKIFGMFIRLQPELKGTGLGLALCKKIAEHHHGSISAIGKVNEGATFILTLPRQLPEVNPLLSQKSILKNK